MKKLLISLLLGVAILSSGCVGHKAIEEKVDNVESQIEIKEDTTEEENLEEVREQGIEFIDLFLKENLSDCYDGYYADENGITIKFVDDGIVELLEADEELYEKFVELNMNICEEVSDILKADKNYFICITYTDKHKEGNRTFTNTFFIIVDGEITVNKIKK